ncbi:MAG: TonB-dependent receptor [Sphingobium sp.]
MELVRGVSLFALAACLSATAHAQDAQGEAAAPQGGLEDIVVTATKRSENLQNVPVAVSAISSSELAAKGVFDTSDLNNSMPNLQVSSAYGSQQPNFSLRGVGVGTELSASAASPVGVYVDEVYQTFRASHGQQLYDLEQVEVVRGPQGTLYGRNTTGGAINFITRKPGLKDFNGYLTAGYGNYDRKSVEGAIELTPVEGQLGIRIAGTYVKSDPYIRNVLPAGLNTSAAGGASGLNFNTGRDPNGDESYGIRGTVRFKPTDGLDVSLKGYAARTTGGVAASLGAGPSRANPDVFDYENPNFILGPVFQLLGSNGAGLLPSTYSRAGLSDREIAQDTVGRAVSRAEGGVLTVKAELANRLNLTSITGYDSGLYLQSQTDCDSSPLRICSNGYKSTFQAFNQDLRLDFVGGPFKIIGGAYYGWDSITSDNDIDIFNFLSDVRAAVGLPATWFNPAGGFNGTALPADSVPTGIRGQQHFKQVRESWAVYGEGSYEFTPALKLTAGLRYTTDTTDYRDGLTTYYDDAGNARMLAVSAYGAPYFLAPVRDASGAIVIPATAGPTPGGVSKSGKTSRISGRAILDWKPLDGVMLYASYSRGYRAGTFNGLAYISSPQVYFVKPEEVNAFEVGFKTRFLGNRLQVNGSFFYYDYKNQQSQVVDQSVTANIITLDGTLKGAEIDVQFAATDRLTLTASLGLLDTKYKDYDQAQCAALNLGGLFPAQDGSCVQSGAGSVSVGGNPFPYAPKTSVNLGFDWTPFETSSGKLQIHGDTSYTGRFYYDSFKDYSRGVLRNLATGAYTAGEGDYWIFNSRISYVADRYTISFWGKNLSNKLYFPAGYPNEGITGAGYLVRALPRTYGVEATVRF